MSGERISCSICIQEFWQERKPGRPREVCSSRCADERLHRQRRAQYEREKEDIKARAKAWRLANPLNARASVRGTNKRWRLANPERARTNANEWKAANPERVKEQWQEWATKNSEKLRQKNMDAYWANPEASRQRRSAWAERNPEKWRTLTRKGNQRRKAARRGISVVERYDPVEIFERDDWTCKLCKRPVDKARKHPDPFSASIEHIIPVSRGGNDTTDNVELAHLRCNLSRGNRMRPEEG